MLKTPPTARLRQIAHRLTDKVVVRVKQSVANIHLNNLNAFLFGLKNRVIQTLYFLAKDGFVRKQS